LEFLLVVIADDDDDDDDDINGSVVDEVDCGEEDS